MARASEVRFAWLAGSMVLHAGRRCVLTCESLGRWPCFACAVGSWPLMGN